MHAFVFAVYLWIWIFYKFAIFEYLLDWIKYEKGRWRRFPLLDTCFTILLMDFSDVCCLCMLLLFVLLFYILRIVKKVWTIQKTGYILLGCFPKRFSQLYSFIPAVYWVVCLAMLQLAWKWSFNVLTFLEVFSYPFLWSFGIAEILILCRKYWKSNLDEIQVIV